MGRSDTLRVRSRSPVVEVDLRARHVSNRRSELLAGPGAVPGTADADHPDEEDQHNHEEDGPGDTASDVGKLRLLGTLEPSEGACALAVRFSLLILEAESAVPAEAVARVKAGVGPDTSPVVAKLALAVEVVGRLEQADGIDVAEFLLALTDEAPVGALALAGGPLSGSAGVGWTVNAVSLLFIRLVFALRTGSALVVICIQELTRNADRKVTVLDGL